MAFERTRKFFADLMGPAPEPIAASKSDLTNPLAYTDQLRAMSGWRVMPYNPSQLVTRRGMRIFDSMKRDEQVKAALQFKKSSILAPGWEIVSPEQEDQNWEVARFCRYALEHVAGGFSDCMMNKILTALDYGYSVTEKVFSEIEEGDWKGKLTIAHLNGLKPHYLDFQTDEYGQLLSVLQQAAFGSGQLTTDDQLLAGSRKMPPGKFIVYTHQKEFENFYGTSDLEAAYRPWWVKDNTYKWLSVTLERFGMPPLFALYSPDAYNAGQIEQLKNVIKNIQNATFGIIPRQTKDVLELWSQDLDQGSSNLFLGAMNKFDEHIARALLVPNMIGMSAEMSTHGSYARSSTHADSFMQVIGQVQLITAEIINDQLIKQLCDLNFPSLQHYPSFRFLPIQADERLQILESWAMMVAGQVVNRIPDDERHIRKLLRFPDNNEPKIEQIPDHQPDIRKDEFPPLRPVTAKPRTLALISEDEHSQSFEYSLEDLAEAANVAEEDLAEEQRRFAVESDCTWVTIKGRKVCIRNDANHDKVKRALLTHKPASAEKQRLADVNEKWVANAIGGRSTGDNDPMDVLLNSGKLLHGVEVKTFTDNTNDKVTVHPDSLHRKVKWARNNAAQLHTVLIDDRKTFGGGENKGAYSGNRLYYRPGVGSFRLGSMVKVRDAAHLKSLILGHQNFEATYAAQKVAELEASGTGGVWRTINGRHILIKAGQTLMDALKAAFGEDDEDGTNDADKAGQIENEVRALQKQFPEWNRARITDHMKRAYPSKLVDEIVGAMYALDEAAVEFGEKTGHPFRGNQWQQPTDKASARALAQDLEARAAQLAKSGAPRARAAAQKLIAAARRLYDAGWDYGQGKMSAQKHLKDARAHYDAAQTLLKDSGAEG